jgi:hypothetical protein
MRKLKMYINHKLYDFSRVVLDWAVKNRHWKLAGRISGWRNRLVEPILIELHSRLIITPSVSITTPVVKTESETVKLTRRKAKIQRRKR